MAGLGMASIGWEKLGGPMRAEMVLAGGRRPEEESMGLDWGAFLNTIKASAASFWSCGSERGEKKNPRVGQTER